MTTHELNECDNWRLMLEKFPLACLSERKLTLYVCAGLRQIWHLLYSESSRNAVDVAERALEEAVSEDELSYAEWAAETPTFGLDFATESLNNDSAERQLWNASLIAYDSLFVGGGRISETLLLHLRGQDEWPGSWLVREIFGNPFQTITIQPEWLRWNGNAVETIAQHVYQNRAWNELPVLADALEEAGCQEKTLLTHCREDGPHVKGCWAIDAILGLD